MMSPHKTRYITGISALNIPTPDNRQPDWHALGMWDKGKFSQNIKTVDAPIDILGDSGLRDITDIFMERGFARKDGQPVYCASPERAICDLAYSLVKRYGSIYFKIDDFLVEEFDLNEIGEYLVRLKMVLPNSEFELIEKALTPKSI